MKIKNLTFLLSSIFICGTALSQTDSIKMYWIHPIKVESAYNIGNSVFSIEKDGYTGLLNINGFSLITKGVFFAQDIYSDGFKRGDINVVVDGERYHNACPNRMDPPLTRVNPVSMSALNLYKTNSTLQSGFAGSVEFIRAKPVKDFGGKLGVTGNAGYSQSFDGYVNTNYLYNNINMRYSFGKPFRDGDNRDFVSLYSYKDDYSYSFAEANFNGIKNNFEYGVSYSHTKNILFPYLQMDEIYNDVFSGNFKYKTYKIYFNYTDHLMTNDLRVSPSAMETKAKNFTLGIFNEFLEFYFRNWLSDNKIVMGSSAFINKSIPNLRQYSIAGRKLYSFGNINISGKLGVLLNLIGSENMDFYKVNFSDASDARFLYRASLSGSYNKKINNFFTGGVLAEFSTEPPEPENLYIAMKRPGTNPWWSGNPDLRNPMRVTLRTDLSSDYFNVELYGDYVIDYANLVKQVTNNRSYQTYKNINAYLFGANISFNYKIISTELSYTYGQNITNDIPLSEIAPLRISTYITTPEFKGIILFVNHIYNNTQSRVDEIINEKPSNTFNVINAGGRLILNNLTFSFEVNNILNNTYYNSLSYARNPYSSGVRVYEPGRNVLFGVLYNF